MAGAVTAAQYTSGQKRVKQQTGTVARNGGRNDDSNPGRFSDASDDSLNDDLMGNLEDSELDSDAFANKDDDLDASGTDEDDESDLDGEGDRKPQCLSGHAPGIQSDDEDALSDQEHDMLAALESFSDGSGDEHGGHDVSHYEDLDGKVMDLRRQGAQASTSKGTSQGDCCSTLHSKPSLTLLLCCIRRTP